MKKFFMIIMLMVASISQASFTVLEQKQPKVFIENVEKAEVLEYMVNKMIENGDFTIADLTNSKLVLERRVQRTSAPGLFGLTRKLKPQTLRLTFVVIKKGKGVIVVGKAGLIDNHGALAERITDITNDGYSEIMRIIEPLPSRFNN